MNTDNSMKLSFSISQESQPKKKKVSKPQSEMTMKDNKIDREKRRIEHFKRMKKTLFRVYIQNLLRTEEAKMDFRCEWKKEKAYNKKHNLKTWLR